MSQENDIGINRCYCVGEIVSAFSCDMAKVHNKIY